MHYDVSDTEKLEMVYMTSMNIKQINLIKIFIYVLLN